MGLIERRILGVEIEYEGLIVTIEVALGIFKR